MKNKIALITGLTAAVVVTGWAPTALAAPSTSSGVNIVQDVGEKVKVFKGSGYTQATLNPKATHFVAYYSASW